jgi:hypothetical protein
LGPSKSAAAAVKHSALSRMSIKETLEVASERCFERTRAQFQRASVGVLSFYFHNLYVSDLRHYWCGLGGRGIEFASKGSW